MLHTSTRLGSLTRLRMACAAAALALACLVATPSQAVLTLKYSINGAPPVTVEDNAAPDQIGAEGAMLVIDFNQPASFFVTGFNDLGVSQPPDITEILILDGIFSTPQGGGSVDIWLSDTGYTTNLPLMTLESSFSISGHPATVSVTNWYDTTNTLFGEGTEIFSDGFTNSLGSGEGSLTPGLLATPYSLTTHISIERTSQGDSSFAAELSVNVPEPAALGLFGAALVGLGVTRRRRA